MDIPQILSSLRSERDRLNKAIDALEGLDGAGASTRPTRTNRMSAVVASKPTRKRKSGLTTAGRKRLSENMKKRWAERRKKAGKPA